MKKLPFFFFLITLFAQNLCFAQSIFPKLADNPRWRVEEYIVYQQPPYPMYFIDYTMDRDTLINGLPYTIIVGSDSSHDIYKTYRVGFLRTEGNKIYFKPDLDSDEHLIVDFGLKVGESCYCSVLGYDTEKFTATKIDTITLNGFQRKRILVESDFFAPDYWIEGIGSIQNPFVPYRTGVQDKLRCLTTNAGNIYIDPKYNECDSNNSIKNTSQNLNNQQIIIYPNPIDETSIIKVNSRNNVDYEFEIFNGLGVLVKKGVFTDNYPVGLLPLYKGTYIVRIKDYKTLFGIDVLIIK